MSMPRASRPCTSRPSFSSSSVSRSCSARCQLSGRVGSCRTIGSAVDVSLRSVSSDHGGGVAPSAAGSVASPKLRQRDRPLSLDGDVHAGGAAAVIGSLEAQLARRPRPSAEGSSPPVKERRHSEAVHADPPADAAAGSARPPARGAAGPPRTTAGLRTAKPKAAAGGAGAGAAGAGAVGANAGAGAGSGTSPRRSQRVSSFSPPPASPVSSLSPVRQGHPAGEGLSADFAAGGAASERGAQVQSRQREFDALHVALNRQLASWAEVEMAASKIWGGVLQPSCSAEGHGHAGAHGRPADFYLQRQISKASEQGNKLTQMLEQLGEERGRLAREASELGQERERLAQARRELSGEQELLQGRCERRLEEEREQLRAEMAEFRAACEQKVAGLARKAEEEKARLQQDCDRRLEEAARRAAGLEAERGRAVEERERERAETARRLAECQAECERKLADERLENAKLNGQFYAEMGRTINANKEEMARRLGEWRVEREQLEQEQAQMRSSLADVRSSSERRCAEEQAAAARRLAALREECERQVAEERAAAERRLAEQTEQSEEQLRTQREITAHIMHVLRELPPLQTAMELGDLRLLEEELAKWRGQQLPERFGACGAVVEAVLKLAQDRLATWRGVERTWKDVLAEAEHLSGSAGLAALTRQGQRVFRVLKEAQLTKMELRRGDPGAMERICQILLAWQERAMLNSNAVQRLIVSKVVNWPELGTFDFADLDICLRLADRRECRGDVFLSRAQALVEDEATAPKDLRPLLGHLETMLYFLKYAQSEDLSLAHAEFRRQPPEAGAAVEACLRHAEREYPPGAELVRLDGRDPLDRGTAAAVLGELRAPGGRRGGALAAFREIFYQWALAMHGRFGLLVLPHHAQVLCLLCFAHFLQAEQAPGGPRALIAQVGTGEGKSMIVAALAIYVVVALGKKAHVVMDDEVLLERDFWTFKRVFDAFEVTSERGRRHLSAVLCASEERIAKAKGEPSLAARVDPDADICYCEAKHVQSYYASIARGESQDFDGYEQCVLILDEVDALVIDEEPNEAFVYPNAELSELATRAAGALAQGAAPEEPAARGPAHPAAGRVAAEMAKEWARAKQMLSGEDFEYVKETGRYCALHAGRADPKSWSLALECRNFQDGLSRSILFQERLFVMSRPRVFRKYHRILGLSGSTGSKPEQAFLKETYCAAFMTVPPFLKTCKGSPFHEAAPVRLGERQRAVFVEPSQEAQISRVAELALKARERVPVLVVARDRRYADLLVQRLRQAACSRGLGAFSEDVVRSLSRTLYEADGEQWKENLNRATLPVGDGSGHGKSWRVTVTDPRGGRGTDYRVDDPGVDAQGGLLLIPTWVPTSRREWTQFLGRTARQDCRGQFCCVLAAPDYSAMSAKYRQPLPAEGGLEVVERVLSWGDRDAAERIRGSAALYNCGVRVNELCEEIFGRRREILRDPASRELVVEVCQRFRWMSVGELDLAFGRIPGLDAAAVPTEARDLGRPSEPALGAPARPGAPQAGARGLRALAPPRSVVFCLDWSASMQSRDTGTPLSRFETCVACLQRLLREQVRDCDTVGVVAFGAGVQVVVPPVPKGRSQGLPEARIAGLRPQLAGGTCFFDAVAQCLQLLGQAEVTPAGAAPWLVCLTDGDDLGSQAQNARGQLVTRMLEAGVPAGLNMVMITVGALKAANVQVIDSWVERAQAAGGLARHLSERDAATIARAFDVVAECLATEVGGTNEC